MTETTSARVETKQTLGLLFSDIEGSTMLLQTLGPLWSTVLMEHREVLRRAFVAHGGDEQGTEGDSFFVTFPTASAAVASAIEGQLALAAHPWPDGVDLKVRMGVHAGEVHDVGGTAVGLAVHEAARVAGVAHGGQVIVSETAARLTPTLPDGAGLRDLGSHALKDIFRPMPLFQATHPGLMDDFPALRAHQSALTNLPHQASTFIGREEETRTVAALVAESRLVTVTGAGGVGKTRLALRAAAGLGAQFPDGVWFVDLAPVNDPDSVRSVFARVIGVSDREFETGLVDKQTLFIVDNCEHLIDEVASLLEQLLRRAANVSFLATSREPLGLGAEVTWRMPSLSVDDAVELFRTRARAANAHFELNETNREAVTEICRRLDHIPLAIELAAARNQSLSVHQIAERLDKRFKLLSSGSRGAMARQRTLQATVDWSHNLLTEPEQILLRRLGVFEAGFNLESAERVCALDDIDPDEIFDLVDGLVAKSLLVSDRSGEHPRFRMLETVRQYARDKMLDADETEQVRNRHLEWFVEYAGILEDRILRGDFDNGVRSYAPDADNFFAAFEWALHIGQYRLAARGAQFTQIWLVEAGQSHRLLDAVRRVPRHELSEPDRALLDFTEMTAASNVEVGYSEVIARAVETAGFIAESDSPHLEPVMLAYLAGEPGGLITDRFDTLEEQIEEALGQLSRFAAMPFVEGAIWQGASDVYQKLGDIERAREAANRCIECFGPGAKRMRLGLAAMCLVIPEPESALEQASQAFAEAKETGDVRLAAQVAPVLRYAASMCGDDGLAEGLGWEVLELGQASGSQHAMAIGHNMIAWHAHLLGDAALADTHSDAALRLAPPNTEVELDAASTRAEILRTSGRAAEAFRVTVAGTKRPTFATAPSQAQMPLLVMLALIAADAALMEDSARLIGAFPQSYHTRHNIGQLLNHQLSLVKGVESRVRESLGVERYEKLTLAGSGLSPAEAASIADGWTF